ncbi:NOP protein chaperone 1 isoform X1 [Peromyscus maniculatus bairdii]|uniref:NOP protein chaperone 1 n=1 Tax=Peromyscus maniculatus bairdii TaxID=230844 RepID=A0A6I9LBH5_PERMB|nr:NOP protein chaperone 1 [Peromyscus maniculatus bairdii]
MELHGERVSGPTASSSSEDCSQVTVSRELLTAGSEGSGGIWDQLLISSKPHSKKTSALQTVRIQRSPLLDQVQAFLPQMAQANEKLREEMAAAPADCFNIEKIDGTSGNIIQMDVALFEMNRSDSKEEDSSEESSQDGSEDSSESEDEDCIPSEVTIDTIKLPNAEGGRGKIEVLDSPASKKKKQ